MLTTPTKKGNAMPSIDKLSAEAVAVSPPPTFAPPSIHVLMAKVAADVGAVSKDRQNEQQKFKFRGIDDLMNALHQHLAEHGVNLLPSFRMLERYDRPTQRGGLMEFVIVEGTFTFTGPIGDSVTVTTIGQASDSADKATNKAMSAALKYALIQTFTVPTRDMDDADRTTTESAPLPTKEELLARIDACCSKLGMPREDLTAKYRERHGGISMEAFENLAPEVLLPFVLSVEAHTEQELAKP